MTKKSVREIWEAASKEKQQEARKKAALILDINAEDVSDDKIISDVESYQKDIADVEINDIDDIIDLIG